MLIESVARRYAKALFDAALSEKSLDTVKHELKQIVEMFEKEERLHEIWISTRIFPQTKKNFVRKVLPQISSIMFHYLFLLIDKRREKILKISKEEYEKLLLDFYNQAFVEVRSVAPIPHNVQADLRARLSERLGKRVELVMIQDPSLIGGMVVSAGDVLLDGSLRTKLAALREDLLNASIPVS